MPAPATPPFFPLEGPSVVDVSDTFLSPITVLIGVLHAGKRLGRAHRTLRWAVGKQGDPNRKAKVFAGYAPTEHDVFIATFSKSGTNWLMQMATQIAFKGDVDFKHIHDVVAWPEFPIKGVTPLDSDVVWQAAAGRRRAIKTNAPAAYVPLVDDALYLSIFRDPKEVLVSAYHFLLGSFGIKEAVTFEQWYSDIFVHGPLVDAWCEHTASWWAERERDNVHILPFKALKDDLDGHVRNVAGWMKVDLSDEEHAAVVEKCSFKWMKANGEKFNPPPFPIVGTTGTEMVRSGKAGNSGELLSVEQQAEVDSVCIEKLNALGSDFPYQEWFT